MQPARDAHDFLSAPLGRYVALRSHLVWCASPSLCGSASWGEPGRDELDDLVRAFDVVLTERMSERVEIFMDASGIERVDGAVLAAFAARLPARLPRWAPRIARQVVVLPDGVIKFALAGVLPSLGGALRLSFFASREEARAALGRAGDPVWREVDAALHDARAIPPLVARLRAHLAAHLADASLQTAAAALSVSPRSLQRELGEGDTSFSAELNAARTRAAAALLADTDQKIEVIARVVGFATSSQLAVAFRRVYGATPAAYRDARRRSPADG